MNEESNISYLGGVATASLGSVTTAGYTGYNYNYHAPYQTVPSTYVYHYTTTATPAKDLELRLVDNGFIVLRQGKEYVFSSTKALTEWIEKEFKQGKK